MANRAVLRCAGVWLCISLAAGGLCAMADTHRAKWMADGSYGLMTHYLVSPAGDTPAARKAELDRIVDTFDLDYFMEQIKASGADWLIFTLGQNTGYYCSPNKFLDAALPGHTSKRDLGLEIARRMKEMGKRFIIYLPAEVAGQSEEVKKAFGWNPGDQSEFLRKYQEFVRQYSLKFGGLADGWWFDGCYDGIHEGKWDWSKWIRAARAGNPKAIVAFNDGAFCVGRIKPVSPLQDYHAGEVHLLDGSQIVLDFVASADKLGRDADGRLLVDGRTPRVYMPDSQFVEGVQWHALVPVDSTFNPAVSEEYTRYSNEELLKFVLHCKRVKGAVTLNVPIQISDGHIPESSASKVAWLGKELRNRRIDIGR